MKKTIFTGAGVAIVTPMYDNGDVNYDVFGELIDYQIENGTDAIIVCGTTGESATLSHEEHMEVIRYCVERTAGRVPVVAGTGSNDTAYALKLSQEACEMGVDALLMVTPYYNKTSQEGLVQHFTYIADRVDKPIILYNVPSRTGVNILPETYHKLSKHPNIVAAKEASGDISAVLKTIALCGDDLDIYTGNDDQITAMMAMGAKGVISVLSNVAPKLAHEIAASFLEGDYKKSLRLQMEYADLCNDLFLDVNPIPVKEAVEMMGFQAGPCRLPLYKMSDEKHEKLKSTMQKHHII